MGKLISDRVQEDDVAAIRIGRNLSHVIMYLASRRGMNQSTMAKALGYSRASFCQLVNAEGTARLWRLPTLCGVCRVLGITLTDLFRAAEGADDISAAALSLTMATEGTAPRTRERLQRLIYDVVGYTGEWTAEPEDRLLAVTIGISVVETGCPDFTADYYSGKLSDEKACDIIRKADTMTTEDGEPMPLWVAIKAVYK